MTVTNSYSLGDPALYLLHDDSGVTNHIEALDLTSLSDGRIAYVGDNTDDGEINVGIGGAGSGSVDWSADDHSGHVVQLADGDLAVTTEFKGDVSWQLLSSAGNWTSGDDMGQTNATNSDLAALKGGGFVITDQLHFSGADSDVQVSIRNAAGAGVKTFSIDVSTADDEAPVVAGLRNGNFVVAWDRATGSATEGLFAIYTAAGHERVAPDLFDGVGTDNNQISVAALAKGGFAVAYTDNGWNGSDNITVETYKANGKALFQVDLSPGGEFGGSASVDSEASITILQDGTIAVSWSHQTSPGQDEIMMQLVDPRTGALLLAAPEVVAADINCHSSSITALGDGQVLVGYSDDSTGAQARSFALDIDHQGDDGNNVILGSGAVDTIEGLGGNDLLKGGAGDDTIDGGNGKDVIDGQAGSDVLVGGAGHDTFQFTSIGDIAAGDEIADLQKGDHINLAGIDADVNTAGDQAFILVGAFDGHAGEMTLTFVASDNLTIANFDVNGDGQSDGSIEMIGDQTGFHHFVL